MRASFVSYNYARRTWSPTYLCVFLSFFINFCIRWKFCIKLRFCICMRRNFWCKLLFYFFKSLLRNTSSTKTLIFWIKILWKIYFLRFLCLFISLCPHFLWNFSCPPSLPHLIKYCQTRIKSLNFETLFLTFFCFPLFSHLKQPKKNLHFSPSSSTRWQPCLLVPVN